MVDKRAVFRYAVYYRAIATASFVAGGGIAFLGVWLGIVPAIGVYLGTFLQPDATAQAMSAANVPLALVLVVVGVSIWQIGKAWAFYWTFTSALDEQAGTPTRTPEQRSPSRPRASQPSGTTESPPGGDGAPSASPEHD